MADLAKIGKEYKALIDKYSPKDKATSKPTRVPKINPDLKSFIDNALFVYDEYELGNIKDTDLVIQALHYGLTVSNGLLKDSYINSHVIEKNERANADVNQALLLGKERMPQSRGGSKGKTHYQKEALALELFNKRVQGVPLPDTNKKQTIESISEELDIPLSTCKTWWKNFNNSDGRTVYKG